MKKHGFTLIELLIVIAIIAILALIAIPNFLEAQTRSKVARVMADMRSVGTAVEAYQVDWSRYPMYYNALDIDNGTNENNPNLTYIPYSLTTPVSYMTSILVDPFRTAAVKSSSIPDRPYLYRHAVDQGTTAFLNSVHMTTGASQTSVNGAKEITIFQAISRPFWGKMNPDGRTVAGPPYETTNYQWFLSCPGPDMIDQVAAALLAQTTPVPTPLTLPYDPTNGTISIGEIMRWGP